MTASDADILDRAADRLEKPGQWTTGAWAKTAAGRPVGPCTDAASCWCLVGAIRREMPLEDDDHEIALVSAVGRQLGVPSAAHWNDAQPFAALVVAALRETAKRLRGEST